MRTVHSRTASQTRGSRARLRTVRRVSAAAEPPDTYRCGRTLFGTPTILVVEIRVDALRAAAIVVVVMGPVGTTGLATRRVAAIGLILGTPIAALSTILAVVLELLGAQALSIAGARADALAEAAGLAPAARVEAAAAVPAIAQVDALGAAHHSGARAGRHWLVVAPRGQRDGPHRQDEQLRDCASWPTRRMAPSGAHRSPYLATEGPSPTSHARLLHRGLVSIVHVLVLPSLGVTEGVMLPVEHLGKALLVVHHELQRDLDRPRSPCGAFSAIAAARRRGCR